MRVETDQNTFVVVEVHHHKNNYILNIHTEVEENDFIFRPVYDGVSFVLEEGRKSNKKLNLYNSMINPNFVESLVPYFKERNRKELGKLVYNHFAK